MSSLCQQATGLGGEQFWREFSTKVADQRVPFSGSLALTYRCNLGCVHCYARDGAGESSAMEMSAGEWKRIIGEIKAAGCLYLLLTGGEPLLREDFPEIYSFAKHNGFLVTVFTNGTLITAKIVELFRELPPRLVEISLYGASAETHDRVTGVPGSFQSAQRAVETLIGNGINVGLKSVLLSLNADEFPAVENLARRYGVNFRLDPAIFPSLAGNRSPLGLRVSPEQAVNLEMADPARKKEWQEFLEFFQEIPIRESLYNCGSGVNTFHIDPHGWLFPCLMVSKVKFPLRSRSFQEGWNDAFDRFRDKVPDPDSPCLGCEQKLVCGYCPGFFEMENGNECIPSDYLCAIGKLRFTKITSRQLEDR